MNKVAVVGKPDAMNKSNIWLQLVRTDLPPAQATCHICQLQKQTLISWFGTIPQGEQPDTWQAEITGKLPPWKRHWFISTRIDTYSKYEFAFAAQRIIASTTVQRFTKCLTYWHRVQWTLHWTKAPSTSNEVWGWTYDYEDHHCYHRSHHPKPLA